MTYDEQGWRQFRAERERELAEPHGWLTLSGFHWLPDGAAALPGLPGRWSNDGTSAHLDATVADGYLLDGRTLDGRSTLTVHEAGRVPWVTHGDVQLELLRRGDRLAIRLRAETSPDREMFGGVPSYDYDPAYVVEGRFVPAGERRVEVATVRPDLRQHVTAIGDVEFTLGGQPQRLTVTSMKYGLGVEFHDPTNSAETPAWRQLKFDAPDGQGTVSMDFNRAVDMWFAFTDFATCPAPIEGNRITVPVRAGERRYRPSPLRS